MIKLECKNKYHLWNKEHAFDERKKEFVVKVDSSFYCTKTKKQRQDWWKSLTPEQQKEYIRKKRIQRSCK